MKKVLWIVVLLVAALLGYNYYTTGTLSPIPSGPTSAEDRELRELDDRFRAARKEFNQAVRGAGLGGIDTTAEAEAAMIELQRVEKGLADLKSRLTLETSKQEADRLERAIREFTKDLR